MKALRATPPWVRMTANPRRDGCVDRGRAAHARVDLESRSGQERPDLSASSEPVIHLTASDVGTAHTGLITGTMTRATRCETGKETTDD